MKQFIIPAIDLINNQCVGLFQGEFDRKTIYSSKPEKVALRWQTLGFKKLHVIDLEGAKTGKIKNISSIKKIVQAVKIPVQVGGGVRSISDVKKLLKLGANQVIVSTAILENIDLLNKLLCKFSNKIIVSLDVKGDKLVKKGWTENTEMDLIKTAKKLEEIGLKKIIYTDVLKDGTQSSPNYKVVNELVKSVKIPVIVAGGVSSNKQVEKLRKIGADSIIIGKALYEGLFDESLINKIDFNRQDGLVPAIIQEVKTNEVLMLGFINNEALKKTIKTGFVWFWSRSRNKLWLKGEKSGNKLQVKKMFVDCDNDTILIKAKIIGKNICHTGNKSCFYRRLI